MNSPGTPSAPQRKSICGIIVHLKAQPSESNLSSLDCKNLAHHPQVPQIPGIVIAYPLSCQDCHDHNSEPVWFRLLMCCMYAPRFGTKSNEEKKKEEQEAVAKKRTEYANPRQGKEDMGKDNEHGPSDTARSGIFRVSNSTVMLEALRERNVRASDSVKLA